MKKSIIRVKKTIKVKVVEKRKGFENIIIKKKVT